MQVCWKHPPTGYRTASSRSFLAYWSYWRVQAHSKGEGVVSSLSLSSFLMGCLLVAGIAHRGGESPKNCESALLPQKRDGNALPTVNRWWGLRLCEICLEIWPDETQFGSISLWRGSTGLYLVRLISDLVRMVSFGLKQLRFDTDEGWFDFERLPLCSVTLDRPRRCFDRPRVVRRWR